MPTKPPDTLPRFRILVVDDEPLIVKTLFRILKNSYRIKVCYSGREALEILRDDLGFDLILCDLFMPETSGIDVYEWLRDQKSPLATQMIFMSGGAFTSRAREFTQTLPNLLVEKPFRIAELLTQIEAALPSSPRDSPL